MQVSLNTMIKIQQHWHLHLYHPFQTVEDSVSSVKLHLPHAGIVGISPRKVHCQPLLQTFGLLSGNKTAT